MIKNHHKISTFHFIGHPFFFWFDLILIIISVIVLIADFFGFDYAGRLNTIILMVVAIAGFLPVAFSATKALWRRRLTIDLLAGLALALAFFSRQWHSAVFICLMLASARLLFRFTEGRAKLAIQSLFKLRSETAHIKTDSGIIQKSIKDIKLGDLVVVDAGERVAVDGEVVSGQASLDQSSLTGESEPVPKAVGDLVFSSTLNAAGSIIVKAAKIGADTTFAKIVKLVEQSHSAKAPISSLADKFTKYYILLTFAAAILIYAFSHNLLLVLSILLVTCADDLAVAIPLAFMASMATAAKRGIIIKGANYLEGFAKIKTIVFDKTGTLTKGKHKAQKVLVFNSQTENEFLAILTGLMDESNHPMAQAACRFAQEKNVKPLNLDDVHEESGLGVRGVLQGQTVWAGNLKFLQDNGIKFSPEEQTAFEQEKLLGRSLIVVGISQKAIGFIAMADVVKKEAFHIVEELKKLGVKKIFMLTGDNETVAAQVAKETGIQDFRAGLLPQDKVEFLQGLLNKKDKTAMVGDGVNDAAALAIADIGVAMGAVGSDVALETADIALMKDNLHNLVDIIKLGRRSLRVVRQNFILWGAINLAGLLLVALGVLGPSGAAAYNFLTDFAPLVNSLRLFKQAR